MREKILVLCGGLSRERDISIKSGKAVSAALRKKNYEVSEYDFDGKLEKAIDYYRPDIVFIALHGNFGEDGTVQGSLELLGIPYTGSGVLASSLCMNKLFSKWMFKQIGVKTPEYFSMRKDSIISYREASLFLKTDRIVIKPNDQGSTLGISIVSDEINYKQGLDEAFNLSEIVIAEEYIKGTEITISIIGNHPAIKILPIIEIVPVHEYYDFTSKYIPGMSQHLIPARISKNVESISNEYGRKIYESFNLRDFSRIDMIVNDEVPYVLEVNTIPGFTETSLVPDAAKFIGITFEDLVEFIVIEALKRRK